MPWKLLIIVVMALLMAAGSEAAPRRRAPPPTPELPGEQPDDDVPLSYADEWPASYVPNLIDIPAAELVERDHPTLELSYLVRRFGGASYSNVIQAGHSGPRFALHVRAGRDLQVSAEAPFYSAEVALARGFLDPEGAFTAFSAGVKYLFPYEVAGFRAAIGFRYVFLDDVIRPVFLPDDYQRMNLAYATISRTPSRFVRWHLMLGRVMVPSLDGLPKGEHTIYAAGLEQQVFHFKDNWGRLIVELARQSYPDARHGVYGNLLHGDDAYGNLALRIRSGILQVEAGTRRAMQDGHDEGYITVVKRF